MREVKFRVYEDGTFNYFILNNILTYREIFSRCLINGLAFEQYTGLKDKNGEEIYEGDIVKTVNGWNSEVVYSAPFFGLDNHEYIDGEKSPICDYSIDFWCDLEIIGNIHENPELIK